MSKHPVHHITDTLGVAAIMARLGVSRHAIRYARTMREFPPAWYAALKDMCDDIGIPCPISVFKWKDAAKKHGNVVANNQVNSVEIANKFGVHNGLGGI